MLSMVLAFVAWGSSHREAPLISRDPAADHTDLYAFISPDDKDSITFVANVFPNEAPDGGPNFYSFGNGVHYMLNIDNDGDAVADITYVLDFKTTVRNPGTFLYNLGPITSLDDPDWNVRQFYTISKIENGKATVLGKDLPSPPVYVGTNSTPDYPKLADAAINSLPGGSKVFAGQRDDPFFIDLRIFDLLQPVAQPGCKAVPGGCFDSQAGKNVHSIVLQVPMADLKGPDDDVIGVWATNSRRHIDVSQLDGVVPTKVVQVSRLGNPLVNEVVIPLGRKNKFNKSEPKDDGQFLGNVRNSHLAAVMNLIFGIDVPDNPRKDLVTIFLTGIPGINSPTNVTPSEQLRINMGAPTGFPNGRLLTDDVLDTSLRAVAGVFACPAPGGNPGVVACLSGSPFDKAPNNALSDGVDKNDVPFLSKFPYVALPHSGNEQQ